MDLFNAVRDSRITVFQGIIVRSSCMQGYSVGHNIYPFVITYSFSNVAVHEIIFRFNNEISGCWEKIFSISSSSLFASFISALDYPGKHRRL